LPSVRKRAYAGLAMTAERRRRVRFGLLLVLAVAVLVVVGGATAQPAVQSPLLLMISIDGLRPDHVTAADTLGLKIPNLRRFLSDGAYAEGVQGVIPTVTYPSHTTLITGVWPARHGIHANVVFDPLKQNRSGWY
jgi:predicted AlkP superfamily pyrophosphatase or phosphodiesterase